MTFFSPLESFRVIPLVYCPNVDYMWFSLNNVTLSLAFIIILTIIFITLLATRLSIVPMTLSQIYLEKIYLHMYNLIGSNVGSRGLFLFPYIVTMYVLIAMCNMLGGMPYSSVVMAQISITAAMGFSMFFGLIILFAIYHRTYAFSVFMPNGAPAWISPLLVMVELISFLFRPISLSVRLFANIMAGHTLIVIITALGYKYTMLFGFPVNLIFAFSVSVILALIVVLESAVQLIQAYVFTLLTCNYINSILYLDH